MESIKDTIKRGDLKTTFLKQMIMRLDYDYLFEEEIEKIVKDIYNYLREKGYRMNSETMAQFDISLNIENMKSNMNSTILDNMNVAKDNRESFSSFVNEEVGIRVEITRSFTTMTFNYKNFKPFEELVEDFTKIIEPIIKIREKFEIKRVGLRKINYYILKDINKIDCYFEPYVIDFNDLIKRSLNQVIGKNIVESFFMDNYKVNQNINISNGILTTADRQDTKVYQIILDFDVYDDNNVDCGTINLLDMNDKLFKLYKSALKRDFLLNLRKEDYIDEEIIKI